MTRPLGDVSPVISWHSQRLCYPLVTYTAGRCVPMHAVNVYAPWGMVVDGKRCAAQIDRAADAKCQRWDAFIVNLQSNARGRSWGTPRAKINTDRLDFSGCESSRCFHDAVLLRKLKKENTPKKEHTHTHTHTQNKIIKPRLQSHGHVTKWPILEKVFLAQVLK